MKKEKRKKWVTLLGSGMVLLGFLCNEIVRESYKEKLDDLSSSESVLATRKDIFDSQQNAQKLANEKALDEAHTVDQTELAAFNQFLEAGRANQTVLQAIHDAVKGNEELSEIGKQEISLQAQSEGAVAKLIGAHNELKRVHTQGELFSPAEALFTKAQFELVDVEFKAYLLLKKTTTEIDYQHAHIEEKYRRWKVVGYVLFGIGWLLNLAGALIGIEGLDIEIK